MDMNFVFNQLSTIDYNNYLEREWENYREKERELPYRRLGGMRDDVIVIMEKACARGSETYTRAYNVTACIRSFTCNHGGASRRRRELRSALIVAPVMSKAKPILFVLDSRQRAGWRQTRSRNKTSLFPSKWHNEWRVSQWRCHSSRFAQRNIFPTLIWKGYVISGRDISMRNYCERDILFLYIIKYKYKRICEILSVRFLIVRIILFSIRIMCVWVCAVWKICEIFGKKDELYSNVISSKNVWINSKILQISYFYNQ